MRVGIAFRVGREQNRARFREKKIGLTARGRKDREQRDCRAGISCLVRSTRARARSRGG